MMFNQIYHSSVYSTSDICQIVAQKLSVKNLVDDTVYSSIQNGRFYANWWASESLISGYAGIAIFFSAMDSCLPNDNWDRVAHEYLKAAAEQFEREGFPDLSLFEGLTGLSMAAYLCSRHGVRYQQLLEKLDAMLINHVQHYLWQDLSSIVEDQTDFIDPAIYNLAQGLSGILIYLSLRKDQPIFFSLSCDIVKKICQIFKSKIIIKEHQQVVPWLVSPAHSKFDQKGLYPEESFLLSTPYGIAGLLSSLSIIAREMSLSHEGYELIRTISDWLVQKQGKTSEGVFWKHTISLKEELSGDLLPPETNRDAWCYGIPSVTRALLLASKALKDNQLYEFANNQFLSLWSKPEKEWNLIGTSFGYGRAGHLAITFRMHQETNNPKLKSHLIDLENGLKRYYDPNSIFGFKAVAFSEKNEYMWIDDPGLLNGASGIALSLLQLQYNVDLGWDRVFAIN